MALSVARARRRAGLLIAIAAAWMLLAEAAIAVSFTESWRISWWVWHVLMVVAFGTIAYASWRMPEYERFSDLYLDEVVGGTREVTILFADLQGFTAFSEAHSPGEVRSMLNTYFEAVLPDIRTAGGRLDRFLGDAVMVTFNVSVDQPDHAAHATARAVGVPGVRSADGRAPSGLAAFPGGNQHGRGRRRGHRRWRGARLHSAR